MTHSALRSMLSDFGHDEPDVHRVIREVLAKLPDEASIRAIDPLATRCGYSHSQAGERCYLSLNARMRSSYCAASRE